MQSLRVWVIDDDTDEHFLLRRILARNGICSDLGTFADPVLAIRQFEKNAREGLPLPELVLVDMNMPHYDGWSCLRALESCAAECGVSMPRAIVLSTTIPFDAAEHLPDHPSLLAVMEKPLDIQRLRELWDAGAAC